MDLDTWLKVKREQLDAGDKACKRPKRLTEKTTIGLTGDWEDAGALS